MRVRACLCVCLLLPGGAVLLRMLRDCAIYHPALMRKGCNGRCNWG